MAHAQMRSLDYFEIAILAYIASHPPSVPVSRLYSEMEPMPVVGRLGDLLKVFRMVRTPSDTMGNLLAHQVALSNLGREYLDTYGRKALEGASALQSRLRDPRSEEARNLTPEERNTKIQHLGVVIQHLSNWTDFLKRQHAKSDLDEEVVDTDLLPTEYEDETIEVETATTSSPSHDPMGSGLDEEEP